MKKNILVAVAAVAFVSFQSCNKTKGDGPSITKNYALTGFSSVDAGLDGEVYYTQDSVYKVEIYAQSNIHDQIETPIVGGELRLQFKKFLKVGKHNRIITYIHSPNITALRINGSGSMFVNQPILSGNMSLKVNGSGSINVVSYTGTTLSADISGSGRITVNGGTVGNSNLQISGSGDIDMLNIEAGSVTTNTSGSGNTTVKVVNALDVRISGSGNVYYRGNPSVNANISGSGKVSRI